MRCTPLAALLATLLAASACAPEIRARGPATTVPRIEALGALPPLPWRLRVTTAMGPAPPQPRPAGPDPAEVLVMADGARLPLRAWRPPEGVATRFVLLALHGLGDHGGNFLADSGPVLAEGGAIAYAYDQRGFGWGPHRGVWAGNEALSDDARVAARLLRARHPGLPLYVMGESLGGAVAILVGTPAERAGGGTAAEPPSVGSPAERPSGGTAAERPSGGIQAERPSGGTAAEQGGVGPTAQPPGARAAPEPPDVAGYLILAPALWGRALMPAVVRGALAAAAHTVPRIAVSAGAGGIAASDNRAALERFGADPLTLTEVRVDLVHGAVGLMDAALEALPRCCDAPTLFLTGANDQVIPAAIQRRAFRRAAVRRLALYEDGWHLLLRDRIRARVAADVLAFMAEPGRPLAAEAAGAAWLR